MSVPHLHRYIYFYQSENALAFAATTSGTALVIDRTTAGISLQRKSGTTPFINADHTLYSIEYDCLSSSTDYLWNNRYDQTPIGYDLLLCPFF